jgi:predicted Rossmann fold nucleotide-binding protein DprA/Smf involved in DNA uptake
MSDRSDASLATLLLANRLFDVGAKPFGPKEYWGVVEATDGDPGLLLGDGTALVALGEKQRGRVTQLLDAATRLAFELERLEQQGFRAITPFDEVYPARFRERLGTQAPAVLYVAGAPSLLRLPAIGIVGSRNVSEDGVAVAEQASGFAAANGSVVVSGGARGVDQRAMAAAYQTGGHVVGYLADSLQGRAKDAETRRVVLEQRVCLATPFKPSAGFSVASAMGRNKLIYAASRVTLVVASDAERGGTWEGAVESLRNGFGRVAVWIGPGAGPGNEELVALGGTAVHEIDELARLEEEPVPSRVAEDEQIALDL